MLMEKEDGWFERSETYKEMNCYMELENPFSEKVGGDEFVAGFMRPDIKFKSEKEELDHLRSAQAILRDEILCAYEFMYKQGMLKAYKKYRDEE